MPIVLACRDCERKVSGLGPIFKPSGDVHAEMAAIKRFYAPMEGLRAHQFGPD